MAQSKTVAAALFIVAFAVAAAYVASASATEDAAARKLLAGDGMVSITTDNLIPASGANSLTKGSAGGVAIQRQLLAGDGMIPITTDDLIPASGAKSLTKGRAGVVGIQRALLSNDWFPKGDFDNGRSGVAGIQSQRQLISINIPFSISDLLPKPHTEFFTKGRAEVFGIEKELADAPAPAA